MNVWVNFCLINLKKKLQILNISGNNLDTLNDIEPLTNLAELYASNNNLNDMKEMSTLLKYWFRLRKLELNGNPFCSKNKYRERIIVQAPNIDWLDGKEIQDIERQFLQNWKESKELTNQRLKQESSMPETMMPQAPSKLILLWTTIQIEISRSCKITLTKKNCLLLFYRHF